MTEKPIDLFPCVDAIKISYRHQFHQPEPCGVRGIDDKGVSLDFTEFSEVHPSCLLNLKGQNAYMETYQRGIFG